MTAKFELVSKFQPAGDQPQAIAKLVEGFRAGRPCQTLLGATGTGKTFTASNVIAQLMLTLVLAHNKTLANISFTRNFRTFFPWYPAAEHRPTAFGGHHSASSAVKTSSSLPYGVIVYPGLGSPSVTNA